MAPGEDMSGHPKHKDRHPYAKKEILALRKGNTAGILDKKTKAIRT
jgi:hypothetical protein